MVTFFFYCQCLIKNTMPDSVSMSFTDTEIQTVHCVQVSISAPLLLFLFLLLLLHLQPVKSNSRLRLPVRCLLWQEDSGSIKMKVSQAQHHGWWFRNNVQILYSECQTITYSLADWQLKTKMDWNNSALARKVNTLKQCLQFKVHKMVNNTVRSVIFTLTLLQWSTFLPLLIITFQSVLPVHLVLDLFVLQNCCCRHFHSIFFFLSRPSGSSILAACPDYIPIWAFCWVSLLWELFHPAWGWGTDSAA